LDCGLKILEANCVAGQSVLKSKIQIVIAPVLIAYLNLISLLLKKVLEFESDLIYNKTSTHWVKLSRRMLTARSEK